MENVLKRCNTKQMTTMQAITVVKKVTSQVGALLLPQSRAIAVPAMRAMNQTAWRMTMTTQNITAVFKMMKCSKSKKLGRTIPTAPIQEKQATSVVIERVMTMARRT